VDFCPKCGSVNCHISVDVLLGQQKS